MNPQDFRAVSERLLQSVASLPPVAIDAISPQTGEPLTWFWFDRVEIEVIASCVDQLDTGSPIDRNHAAGAIAAQIVRWGRAEAAAKRVWSFHDRRLREWKAAQYVLARAKPANADEKWKPPSEAAIEADYRRHVSYGPLNAAVERAEEAHSTARSVLSAWTTLGAMLARDGT